MVFWDTASKRFGVLMAILPHFSRLRLARHSFLYMILTSSILLSLIIMLLLACVLFTKNANFTGLLTMPRKRLMLSPQQEPFTICPVSNHSVLDT